MKLEDWKVVLREDKLHPSDGSLVTTGLRTYANWCLDAMERRLLPSAAFPYHPDNTPKLDMNALVKMLATWNCLHKLEFRNRPPSCHRKGRVEVAGRHAAGNSAQAPAVEGSGASGPPGAR